MQSEHYQTLADISGDLDIIVNDIYCFMMTRPCSSDVDNFTNILTKVQQCVNDLIELKIEMYGNNRS